MNPQTTALTFEYTLNYIRDVTFTVILTYTVILTFTVIPSLTVILTYYKRVKQNS